MTGFEATHNLYLQQPMRQFPEMIEYSENPLIVRKAETKNDREAVFSLRYDVFVTEMAGDGQLVDHAAGLEYDKFDARSLHLMLLDPSRGESVGEQIVGTFRFMDHAGAEASGGFYSAGEYDLAPLLGSGKCLLECGRSCLRREYRGGAGLHLLWSALAREVEARGVDLLFGVASFPGRDPIPNLAAVSYLHHSAIAPAEIRPRALRPVFAGTDLLPPDRINRLEVMRNMPALIKAYLRLGGVVGDGAFVDDAFNTTDVCMVLPVADIPDRQRRRLLD